MGELKNCNLISLYSVVFLLHLHAYAEQSKTASIPFIFLSVAYVSTTILRSYCVITKARVVYIYIYFYWNMYEIYCIRKNLRFSIIIGFVCGNTIKT